ncbi:hypothetical protein PP187_gp081 [Klebsiella phage vB_KvM-Eowyn]|uniref:Uncharacterized protein n=1 Tax=Klebsiella phage vB_KvM-Eowyn TaxID=2762819 RepID=A0A7R8R523_9CAUD|nr:hypothetical protein PP187_gp081 [Klebsiella phage vB_KvM-Eowyn]CAD5236070.1 hypothetical protein LLCLJKAH_00081 [Klebsiella phage vB_KvM-Eowyn]
MTTYVFELHPFVEANPDVAIGVYPYNVFLRDVIWVAHRGHRKAADLYESIFDILETVDPEAKLHTVGDILKCICQTAEKLKPWLAPTLKTFGTEPIQLSQLEVVSVSMMGGVVLKVMTTPGLSYQSEKKWTPCEPSSISRPCISTTR